MTCLIGYSTIVLVTCRKADPAIPSFCTLGRGELILPRRAIRFLEVYTHPRYKWDVCPTSHPCAAASSRNVRALAQSSASICFETTPLLLLSHPTSRLPSPPTSVALVLAVLVALNCDGGRLLVLADAAKPAESRSAGIMSASSSAKIWRRKRALTESSSRKYSAADEVKATLHDESVIAVVVVVVTVEDGFFVAGASSGEVGCSAAGSGESCVSDFAASPAARIRPTMS